MTRSTYLLTLLLLATTTPALAAGDRTVIRHAEPGEGDGLVLDQAPPSAERRRALEAWHRRYVHHVAPVRRQARALFRLPEETDDPGAACHELGREVVALGEAEIHDAPHFAVRHQVDAALLRLGRAVTACLAGRLSQAHLDWVAAEKTFGATDRLLIRLGL